MNHFIYRLLVLMGLCFCAVSLHAGKVPSGFDIQLYAGDVDGARQMALSEAGIVYVGSRRAGKVHALVDLNGDYKADQVIVVAKGLNMPSGVAYRDGDLYVAEVDKILRFKDIDKNYDKKPSAEVVFSALPNKSHHGWKYIKFGPDGQLYIPVGVPCNVCLEKDVRFGTILALNLENEEVTTIASGVRNSVGFDWNPVDNNLWFTDNGRDWLGDDTPPCELNRVSKTGQFFGFPYVHGKSVLDPEFGKQLGDKKFQAPMWEFQAHVAPLGMLFYQGKQFPKQYQNSILVAQHGSWNRSKKVGYKVVALTLDKNGEVKQQDDFIEGWLRGEEILARPNDIIELKDGSILVSDDGFSKVYRISYKGKK